LKKKNQELEKFKFVLDYKIQELKKQIEPRENDIKAMKDQIQEVCALCSTRKCCNSSFCLLVMLMYDILCQSSPTQVSYLSEFTRCKL